MKTELKLCPGCGNIPTLIESMSDPDEGPGMGYYWYKVECSCGWSGKSFRWQNAEEKAIIFWNKRT